MSKLTSNSGRTLTLNGSRRKIAHNKSSRWYAMGICGALLAWCPAGRAQSNDAAPASAEEVKQLRDVVQSLLVRVTELEKELKERPPTSTERVANSAVTTRDVPAGSPDAAETTAGSARGSGGGIAYGSASAECFGGNAHGASRCRKFKQAGFLAWGHAEFRAG